MLEHPIDLDAQLRIAVIDDDVNIHNGLRMILEQFNHQPSFFFDTREFLNSACAKDFHCIFLDVLFGHDINQGLDLLERFQEDNVSTPIIMMSGLRDGHINFLAGKFGAKVFLDKPISPFALYAALREALMPGQSKTHPPLVDPKLFATMLSAPTHLEFKQWQALLHRVEVRLDQDVCDKLKSLTFNQAKVFLILAQEGLLDKQLADRLGIGIKGAQSHKEEVRRKLGKKTSLQFHEILEKLRAAAS